MKISQNQSNINIEFPIVVLHKINLLQLKDVKNDSTVVHFFDLRLMVLNAIDVRYQIYHLAKNR